MSSRLLQHYSTTAKYSEHQNIRIWDFLAHFSNVQFYHQEMSWSPSSQGGKPQVPHLNLLLVKPQNLMPRLTFFSFAVSVCFFVCVLI